MTLHDRITSAVSAFLKSSGWTARALSLAAGCGPSTVRELLAGRDVRVSTAEMVATVVRANAPDTPEGRRAAALADWSVPMAPLPTMETPHDTHRNGTGTR
jgi:lambda repressor-like predicted transcriptional regulator